jgi:hypothetical protein
MNAEALTHGEAEALRRVVAQQEIRDVLHRYCRAVDRADWGLLQLSYHPDAVDDHGSYQGDVPGLVAWLKQRFRDVSDSTHFLGQVLVELTSSETAFVETYFISRRLQPPGGDGLSSLGDDDLLAREVWGRYLDDFECRNGRWAIVKRLVVVDASYLSPALGARGRPDQPGTQGLRSGLDPVQLRSAGMTQANPS